MAVQSWSQVLREFEGVVPWLYADGTGLPTAGVGHACETPEEAVVVFNDPRAAQDWHVIKNSLGGQAAHLYEPLTVCRLTDEQIDALEATDIAETERMLHVVCPDSAGWPEAVRAAALDIQYNVKGGIATFPHMLAAIRRQDWETASQESHRPQLQTSRNQWTAATLLSAAA